MYTMSGLAKYVAYLHTYFQETLYIRLYIIWKINYACDNMAHPSVSLFLVSTLPLLPSHAVIKNNLVFLKLLCSWVFPIISSKELL